MFSFVAWQRLSCSACFHAPFSIIYIMHRVLSILHRVYTVTKCKIWIYLIPGPQTMAEQTGILLMPGIDGTGMFFEPLIHVLPQDIPVSVIAYPQNAIPWKNMPVLSRSIFRQTVSLPSPNHFRASLRLNFCT